MTCVWCHLGCLCNVVGPSVGEVGRGRELRRAGACLPDAVRGIGQAIDWSRKRGEAAQHELIGMTAKVEVDGSFFVAHWASGGSKAGEATEPTALPTTFETEDMYTRYCENGWHSR
jgi:hypothetical protein